MTVRDDYPAVAQLAYSNTSNLRVTPQSLKALGPESVRLYREVERLRAWKAAAEVVLVQWHGYRESVEAATRAAREVQ